MALLSTSNETQPHRTSRFFEPSRLAGLERMRFSTKRRVEGAYSGRHVSRQRGGSGEFVDYREYSPGDDIRRIDWKAMGRTGRSYLKLYQDETDLHCTLLVDCSGSMLQGGFGKRNQSGSKLEWAQYFATALSHLIVLGRDSVGLAVVRDSIEALLPPSSSHRHRNIVHAAIEQCTAGGKTSLSSGLDELLLRSRRRGVLFMLSDFLVDDFESSLAKLRNFRAAGWEIIALHIVHPAEVELPDGAAFQFTGMEFDGSVNCQVADVREAYRRRFQEHVDSVRSRLIGIGCDYLYASATESYLDVLRNFMVTRNA